MCAVLKAYIAQKLAAAAERPQLVPDLYAADGLALCDFNDDKLEYDGRFLVKLGATDNTEYKFGKMLSAASQLSADDAGTLDVSEGDKVIFNPN